MEERDCEKVSNNGAAAAGIPDHRPGPIRQPPQLAGGKVAAGSR